MNGTHSTPRRTHAARRRDDRPRNPYGFIHHGAKVLWNDPANSERGDDAENHARTPYVVYSVNGSTSGRSDCDDDVILIYDPAENYGEAEVPPWELRPYNPRPDQDTDAKKADALLISCIKYADKRMRKAESDAREAKSKLDALLELTKEERTQLKRDAAYASLNEEAHGLRQAIGKLRKELAFYQTAYVCSKQPPARDLSSFGEDGFINTPDHIGRFLARCPLQEPQAADPDVRVVVEDGEGERNPVTGIWYDPLTGEVRITF